MRYLHPLDAAEMSNVSVLMRVHWKLCNMQMFRDLAR